MSNERSLVRKAQDQMEQEIASQIIDMVKPALKPALEKLNEYLGDDEKMIIIRRPKDMDTVVAVIETDKVEKFSLSTDEYERYSAKDFVENLLSGNLNVEK